MALTPQAAALFGSLHQLGSGSCAWYLVDRDGVVLQASEGAPAVTFVLSDGECSLVGPAQGVVVTGAADRDEVRPVVVLPEGSANAMVAVVRAALGLVREIERAEQDLEGMYPSSLALLEEVSMVNEIMPKLPTGTSERDVAGMAVQALLLAAGVERAFYLKFDRESRSCEILVHAVADASGRTSTLLPVAMPTVRVEEGGLLSRAIFGKGDAILESVEDVLPEARLEIPELRAKRQAIAVPVCFGDKEHTVTLGVLLFLDKRENHVSGSRQFGSGETQLAVVLASMLGSVLGSRMVAELGKELEMAQTIQRQILPDAPTRVPGFDIAGICTNSGAVGGDYFDYLPMADGRQLVVVADVSGHNLASGMLMVSARATLRVLAAMHGSITDVFDDLGAFLFGDLGKTERFITAVGAALRPRSATVELVSAGHNATMICRANTRAIEAIPTDNTVFGFLPTPRQDRKSVV